MSIVPELQLAIYILSGNQSLKACHFPLKLLKRAVYPSDVALKVCHLYLNLSWQRVTYLGIKS